MLLLPDHVQLLDVGRKKAIKLVIKNDKKPLWRGGGGLNACPDGLGHFFREELSKFKRAFAWFGGGQR